MNFGLAVVLLLMESFKLKETMFYGNLLIGIFNLLPIYPLDGGRALKAIINKFSNKETSEEIINKTSNIIIILLTILASIGVLYLKNIAVILIIAYLWYIRTVENKKYRLKMRVRKIITSQKTST